MATLKRKQRALITAMLIIVHMAAEGGRAPREFHDLFDLPGWRVGIARRVAAVLLASFIKP